MHLCHGDKHPLISRPEAGRLPVSHRGDWGQYTLGGVQGPACDMILPSRYHALVVRQAERCFCSNPFTCAQCGAPRRAVLLRCRSAVIQKANSAWGGRLPCLVLCAILPEEDPCLSRPTDGLAHGMTKLFALEPFPWPLLVLPRRGEPARTLSGFEDPKDPKYNSRDTPARGSRTLPGYISWCRVRL
jgi:hypothetical protein